MRRVLIGVLDTSEWTVLPEQIRQVCLSAARCFDQALGEADAEPIRIEPSRGSTPLTRFQRHETGQVVIEVTVRGPYWSQLAFQFAHEFAHVLANFRETPNRETEWIDETLCELASLFALRSMTRQWRVAPPFAFWANYANSLERYAADRIGRPERVLPVGMPFGQWLAEALPFLSVEPLDRDRNGLIANRLLPMFEEDLPISGERFGI